MDEDEASAGVVGVLVLIAGIAGGITHRVFFVPALAALAVGTVKLWRGQA